MAKIRNFDNFGAVFPHFYHNKCEIWHGKKTVGPLPHSKFHVCRGNVSSLRGEKPIFGPVSKNNTGMAALRADLPVTNKKTSHFFCLQPARDPRSPSYLAW